MLEKGRTRERMAEILPALGYQDALARTVHVSRDRVTGAR